ncbi:MAG: peptidase S11 [Neisseriaceae bacterium]|nr:MAG: peptidase S11 [Neisseriaceae bacterium]
MKKLLSIILCSAISIASAANSSNSNSVDPILDAATPQSSPSKNTTTKTKKHHKKKAKAAAAPKSNSSQAVATSNRQPKLYSYSGYAMDVSSGEVLVSKNPTAQLPIASITKLMTAMVMLDSGDDLDEYIAISEDDVDHLRNTYSRLKVGMQLRRRDLLLLALMSSENRAAFAIARTAYPGGINEFIRRMNAKAKALGMTNTQFFDPTGLTAQNKSTAIDLAKMVKAAYGYELIREDTTTKGADVMLSSHYTHHYLNSDALVRTSRFQIEVSKTGFINEAGHCLVLYAMVDNRPIAMVFLNSSKSGRLVDAMAVKSYIDRMQ